MYRPSIVLFAGLLLGACENEIQYSGFDMDDFFPVDGTERGWVMDNMDTSEQYVLDIAFLGEPEVVDGDVEVFTFDASRRCIEGVEECGAGPAFSYGMSVEPLDGIRLHHYSVDGADPVVFDTPMVLAKDKMARGDTVTTDNVDGHSFTVTFVDLERELDDDGQPTELAPELGCDQTLRVNWECAHLKVESTPAGHWLAGDWWAAAGYNVVAFKRTNDSGKWRTIDVSYTE